MIVKEKAIHLFSRSTPDHEEITINNEFFERVLNKQKGNNYRNLLDVRKGNRDNAKK